MHDVIVAVLSGVGGAVLAILANWLFPCRTRVEQPLVVAMRETFVSLADFRCMAAQTGEDIKRLHDKIEADQRAIAVQISSVSLMLGRLEGKIDALGKRKR